MPLAMEENKAFNSRVFDGIVIGVYFLLYPQIGFFMVRNSLLLFVIFTLGGCAGASEGKSRGRWSNQVHTKSCAADCEEWDSEGEICLHFHRSTSERCALILSEELERGR